MVVHYHISLPFLSYGQMHTQLSHGLSSEDIGGLNHTIDSPDTAATTKDFGMKLVLHVKP